MKGIKEKMWDEIDEILKEIKDFLPKDKIDVDVEFIYSGYRIKLTDKIEKYFFKIEFFDNKCHISSSEEWGCDFKKLEDLFEVLHLIKQNEEKFFEWHRKLFTLRLELLKLK